MTLKMQRTTSKIPCINNKLGEKWMPYEGYLLSNKGRWYSLKAKKIMLQNQNSSGYYRAALYKNGKRKHVFTHIKVVELFGDKNGNRIPEGCETLRELKLSIDHVNRHKEQNSVDNLEIVTHVQNCQRKYMKKEKQNNGRKTK